jgi:hypothetical protein
MCQQLRFQKLRIKDPHRSRRRRQAQFRSRRATYARSQHLAPGLFLRVDTTVVETNIHYPTDSSLLSDASASAIQETSVAQAYCYLFRV